MAQALTRVFISFDFENHKILRDFVIEQAKNPASPFQVADWSMKEAAPQRNWETEAGARINRSDVVLVIVGKYTNSAPGVLKEVKFATEAGKRVHQIIGYRDSHPAPVPGAGRLLRWNWDNLERVLKRETIRSPRLNISRIRTREFRNRRV